MTGRRDTGGWEMRGYTMMPQTFWGKSYWSPVPSWGSGNTDLFIYNPNNTEIEVSYEDQAGAGSFTIPAKQTSNYRTGAGRYVPENSGVHLYSDDTFWGIVSGDTGSATWDWGCSLIPEDFLGTDNYVSWAPGTSNLTANGSPVYVTALEDNTRVFVDYGPNDGVFDLTFNLNKLQVYQVFAPAGAPYNNDNTGMHIVSTKRVSIAWGESADRAGTGNPYLDMGYTTLPLPIEWIDLALQVEKTADPKSILVGDESEFTIVISVPSTASEVTEIDPVDKLPPGWEYVAGSSSVNVGEPVVTGGISTGYTLIWNKNWTISPGDSQTFTFRGEATATADTTNPNRDVASATGVALGAKLTADDDAFVEVTEPGPAVISAEKTWSLYEDVNGNTEVNPGDILRYVITVSNTGDSAATSVTISDDTLDPNTSLVVGTVTTCQCPGCTVTKGNTAGDTTVEVLIGTLEPGTSVEVCFRVEVSGIEDFTQVVNSGAVTADGPLSDDFSVTTPVVIPPPVLTITKLAPAEAVVDPSGTGTIIQYTGTLTNTTQTPARNVVLVDTLPPGVTFVSSSHNAQVVGNTVTWNLGTLGPGASIPGWLTVRVAADTPNDTVLTNHFTVTWEDFYDNPLGPATDTADTIVYTHPQLTIEKTGPATAIHDEQFSYTITIRNIGDAPAFDVALEDTLPAGLSYVGSSPSGTYTSGPPAKVTWANLGDLQANGVMTVTVTVTVNSSVSNGTALTDSVGATWKDELENPYGPVTDTAETTVFTAPSLTITKSGPSEAVVGDTITFTGALRNVGGSDALNVVLVDQLPLGMTFVSSSQNAVYNIESNTVTWSLGTVPAGGSAPGWLTVKISDQLANASLLTDRFTVTGEDAVGNPIPEATDTADTTVYTHPILAIEKTGPAQGYPGQSLTYTIQVTNIGGTTAVNVSLADSLPTGLTYQSSNPAGSHAGGLVTWDLGTIQSGGVKSVTVTATVDATVGNNTPLTDTASVTWKNPAGQDFGPAADTANTTIYTLPRVQITKSAPAEAEVNSLITYTGELTNVGGAEARNVVLVDALPSGVTFVSSSQNAIYDPVANTVTWNLGNIGPGITLSGWLTVRISGDLTDASILTNVFRVSGEDTLGNPIPEATDTADTTVYTHPFLTIRKSGPAQAYPGENITYTLQVNNAGGTAAQSVVVTDSLPTGLTYQSSIPAGAHSAGVVTWNIGTILPGDSVTISLTVSVDPTIENGNSLTDTATVVWQNSQGQPFGPASDTAQTAVYTRPQLTISKTGSDHGYPGETLNFSIRVCNVGGTTAQNITLEDLLPEYLVYQNSNPAGTHAGGVVTWNNLGNLNSGACTTVTLAVTIAMGATDGSYPNLAQATWEDGDGSEYGPASDEQDVVVNTHPSLTIEKTGPSEAYTGQSVTYTITVRNDGGTPSANVVLVDSLPMGLTYQSSNPAGTHAGGMVTWNLGTIEVGNFRTVTVTAIVDLDVASGALLRDTASVRWENEGGQPFGPVTDSADTLVDVCPGVTLSPNTDTLPNGAVGLFYRQVISASGGTGPYNYQVVGDLPEGLTSNVSQGSLIISGMPRSTGTWAFTVIATDTGGDCSISHDYTIQIHQAATPVPTLSEWGLILMTLLLGWMGCVALRSRRASLTE